MTLPLEGIRVLDLTRAIAGPFGSMLLADMGAEVLKIEMPTGDPSRGSGHSSTQCVMGESLFFLSVNRNKKSLTLDLKKSEARKVFYDLVKVSDVVFDNYRPGVMKRLGIDYEKVRSINPRIVSCSLSGFGSNGPYRDHPAYDAVIQALSGIMKVTAEPGRAPLRVGFAIGDTIPSIYAAFAITSALMGRQQTGKGCSIDLGALDCVASLLIYYATCYLANGNYPPPLGGRDWFCAPWGAHKTRDGYLSIAIPGDNAWHRFSEAVGLGALESDPRFATNDVRIENVAELTVELERFFADHDTEHWLKLMRQGDVVCSPVHGIPDVVKDPQLLAREMIVELPHPVVGSYKMMGNPIKGSIVPQQRLEPTPLLGEHTRQVLSEILHYSEERIESLQSQKAI